MFIIIVGVTSGGKSDKAPQEATSTQQKSVNQKPAAQKVSEAPQGATGTQQKTVTKKPAAQKISEAPQEATVIQQLSEELAAAKEAVAVEAQARANAEAKAKAATDKRPTMIGVMIILSGFMLLAAVFSFKSYRRYRQIRKQYSGIIDIDEAVGRSQNELNKIIAETQAAQSHYEQQKQILSQDYTNARATYERLLKIQHLSQALQKAHDMKDKATTMAQLTRSGHVYIISNIGSFGEEVYKIGMTRRLEPLDRVRELGDASVPFEFDVHAMIYSEDAPALEKEFHKQFESRRVNLVNDRRE